MNRRDVFKAPATVLPFLATVFAETTPVAAVMLYGKFCA